MKTASERQAAYQKRRRATMDRIVVWLEKDVLAAVDRLRQDVSRQDWLHHAVMLEMVRNLLDRPIPYTNADLAKAAKLGSDGA